MSNTNLAKLNVVIDATMKPFQDEMRKLKRTIREYTKDVAQSTSDVNKSMEKQLSPLRRVQQQIRKMNETMKSSIPSIKSGNQYQDMSKSISSAEKHLKKLLQDMDDLRDSGKDVEFTQEYRSIQQSIDSARKSLTRYEATKDRMKATGTANQESNSWKYLQYNIDEARNSVKAAEADMRNLSDADKYQHTDKWRKLQKEIERTRMELAEYYEMQKKAEIPTGRFSTITGKIKTALGSGLSGVIKKSSGLFAALIQKFKSGIPWLNRTNSSLSRLGHSGRGLGEMFRTIGMTAKFMFASFVISGVLNGATEGLQNLAKYNNEVNKNISILYSDLLTLKNAFATAFAPILSIVTPYLDTLMTYLINATNAVAQFFATLTGQTTWIKATKVQQNYADSLDSTSGAVKKLQRDILGFDEINKLSDDSGSGGGAGAGTGVGDMFSTETVSNSVSEFAQMVKDAWKNADFTEVGRTIGIKLKNALDSINWTDIKASCKKIAKSIGTFINGFVETEGLGTSIGKTIGELINTGVGTVEEFVDTTHFDSIGKFVADGINGTIDTIEPGQIGRTIAKVLNAALDFLLDLVTEIKWDEVGKSIGENINSFFKEFKFEELAQVLNGWVDGLWEMVKEAIDTIEWEEVLGGLKDFFTNLEPDTVATIIGIAVIKKFGNTIKTAIMDNIGTVTADIPIQLKLSLAKGVGAAVAGWSIGTSIYELLAHNVIGPALEKFGNDPDMADAFKNFKWTGDGGFFDIAFSDNQSFSENIKDLSDAFKLAQEDGTLDWVNDLSGAGSKINDLKDAIKGLKNEDAFDFELNFKTTKDDVKKWWGNVKKWWGDKALSVKNAFDTTKSNVTAWWGNVKNWWGDKKLSVKNKFDTTKTNITAWWGNVKSWWGDKKLSVKNKFDTTANTVKSWASNISSWWSKHKPSLKLSIPKISLHVEYQTSGLNSIQKSVTKALGLSGWPSLKFYANGGFPESGQLFMARENGINEMVGTIGGRSAVANNDQIVTAVSAGVYKASVAAFAQFSSLQQSSGNPEIHIHLGTKEITDYVIKDINGRTISNGRCPIRT